MDTHRAGRVGNPRIGGEQLGFALNQGIAGAGEIALGSEHLHYGAQALAVGFEVCVI